MKMFKTIKVAGITWLTLYGSLVYAATPQVKNVKATQQYPWGKVYISYEVVGDVATSAGSGNQPFLFVTAKDKVTGHVYGAISSGESCLSGDTGTAAGLHEIVWDIGVQGVEASSDNMVFSVSYCDEVYLVVDLSSGAKSARYPISYLVSGPVGGWSDTYKTTKMVLRRIAPGSFKMCNEFDVTLTKPFYMGVFEVTQKQYQLVMDANPSTYKGDTRPAGSRSLTWNAIRGNSDVYKWPITADVDPETFVGRLQARTGLILDLPTEAQWEYACRAGTTSSYNDGWDGVATLNNLGRYSGNLSDGKGGLTGSHTVVGSYKPNAWGLYDMHGNVQEWCLDYYGGLSSGVIDPVGQESNTYNFRVLRGGGWDDNASGCTASKRHVRSPDSGSTQRPDELGFRIACRSF